MPACTHGFFGVSSHHRLTTSTHTPTQIARLQKKGPAAGSAPSSAEAELRAEVDALRKEAEQVPLEVVKWRAAAENAQAQLDALVDEKGLGACVEGEGTDDG